MPIRMLAHAEQVGIKEQETRNMTGAVALNPGHPQKKPCRIRPAMKRLFGGLPPRHIYEMFGSKTLVCAGRPSIAIFLSLALLLNRSQAADASVSNLLSFSTGTEPYPGVIQGADGALYGLTRRGGDGNDGLIYRISPAGNYMPLHAFLRATDGAFPYASLIQTSDGYLYGTATEGGSHGLGTLFRITTNGVFTTLHFFDGSDGAYPYSGLIRGPDGHLYGTTTGGGDSSLGTVFRLNSNNSISLLHSFTGVREGAYPYGGLVLARDGNFYGTTTQGGAESAAGYNLGTVFRLSPAGTLATLHTFSGGDDGAFPYAGLTEARSGVLYGVTAGAIPGSTTSSAGTVFRISPSGEFTNAHSFTSNDSSPYGRLVQASDGFLYGTTSGGTNGNGTLFRISSTGEFSTLVAFNGGNGASPFAGVIQGADGSLYGTTIAGGAAGGGTVFRYALTAPPFFVVQPVSQTVTNNTTVTFTVVAGGSGPLTYRWLKGTLNLNDAGGVSGSTTSTLTIYNAPAEAAGSYSVVISNPYGMAVSSNATLTVLTVRPVVSVTSPPANSRSTNDIVAVAGKGSGKLGVASVWYQVNGGEWLAAHTTNNWASWNASVTPDAGTNVLRVYAEDSGGRRSFTNTTRFFHIVTTPISVHVGAGGTVNPNLDGQHLAILQGYTMTARPARGFAFTGWTGSATSSKPKLTFIMQPGLEFNAAFADVMRPLNWLLSPRKRQRFTNESIVIAGRARDNAPGATVLYQLNTGEWLTAGSTNGFTNWAGQVTLAPGTNVIRACTIDGAGLASKTNVVSVVLTP